MKNNKNIDIVKALMSLCPTGPDGFEGLIAELLTSLTGRKFHLAKSGTQGGRDMSMREPNCNVVVVECKRYGKETELDERDLLGEIAQALRSIPDLDVWVLVTSRSVPSQLIEALCADAKSRGIEFVSISNGDGQPSSLEVLCASNPVIVLDYLKGNSQITSLKKQLNKIAAHPNFNQRIDEKKDEFLSPLIGYANWRESQNKYLKSCFQSKEESRASFCQVINVAEKNTMLIPRESANKQLNSWYNSWSSTKKTFVLLGEEGDGKTWTIASWLNEKIQKETDFPAVIFQTSSEIDCFDPLSVIKKAISTALKLENNNNLNKRINRWCDNSKPEKPKIILVLDGINQHSDTTNWRKLLDKLVTDSWKHSVAVLVTCRKSYWQVKLDCLADLKITSFTLKSYNDKELKIALKYNGLKRSDISSDLIPLICKPRYFELMVKHRKSMEKCGDVTVARLIYEDWKDRYKRNSNNPLDDGSFQEVIKTLAKKEGNIRIADVKIPLPYESEKARALSEICTGGILEYKDSEWHVNENHLTLGLGLLLVDVIKKDLNEKKDANEIIAEWLESQAEMDIKAKICESATLHALTLNICPNAKVSLLVYWLNCQNLSSDIEENFMAYCPIDPKCYIKTFEIVWSDRTFNRWAQNLLIRTFVKHQKIKKVMSCLIETSEKWLGYVHQYGFISQRGRNGKDKEKVREEILKRVGHEMSEGQFTFAGYNFTAIEDDNLLRLGNAALAVISYFPRKPFMSAIATGCVAEAIMDNPEKYDLFKWVISTSPKSLWHKIKKESENILQTDSIVTKQAAHRLLTFEGNIEAEKMKQTLPKDLFQLHPFAELHEKAPCLSPYAWSVKECEEYLPQSNVVTPDVIIRKIQPHCFNPKLSIPNNLGERLAPLINEISIEHVWMRMGTTHDDLMVSSYEPALCAYAPESYARLIRRIVREAKNREDMKLRQLAFKLTENYIIFSDEEWQSIEEAWEKLCYTFDDWSKTEELAEAHLFEILLKKLKAKDQLQFLLRKPNNSLSLEKYIYNFLPIEDWQFIWKELAKPIDIVRTIRILWFISAYPELIPKKNISKNLFQLIEHENNLVRRYALQILHGSKSKVAIKKFIKSSWTCDAHSVNDEKEMEYYWGSKLLCEYGKDLPYDQIRSRVDFRYLGYAIRCRGIKDTELDEYIKEIYNLLNELVSKKSNNQRKLAQAKLYYFVCDSQVLEKIIIKRPTIINKWAEYVLNINSESDTILRLANSFYTKLCDVLLRKNTDLGFKLYIQLHNRCIITTPYSLELALFNASPSKNVKTAWQERIEYCTTDKELMDIAISAQLGKGKSWLISYIDKRVNSSSPLEKSRAITLLGFMDYNKSEKNLNNIINDNSNSWINKLANCSLQRWNRNNCAKHWYRTFLSAETDILSWAAFRLFLQCVDSRFKIWEHIIKLNVKKEKDLSNRLTFFDDNYNVRKNKIKKYEDKLSKTLFNQRVKDRQVWPWI